MQTPIVALALAAVMTASPATQERRVTESLSTAGVDAVRIDFPVGQLHIEGTGGNRVEAVLRVDCSDSWSESRCEDRAERIELTSRTRGGTLEVDVEGYSFWRNRGVEIELQLRIPAALATTVDMGIGELEIVGMRGDLDVDLGIGEATVHLDEAMVGSVKLDTGIGETSLRSSKGRSESAGLFTRELRMDNGSGTARIRVEVGIGELDVRLR